MYNDHEKTPIKYQLDKFNISIDLIHLKNLRLVSLLIVQKYMRYIWQAAKVLLCKTGEMLQNTGTCSNKGPSV